MTQHQVSPEVRAAIAEFLRRCQIEAVPLATVEALGALQRMFPGLNISDVDLIAALWTEASAAGFDIAARTETSTEFRQRSALERWDNEGGAS